MTIKGREIVRWSGYSCSFFKVVGVRKPNKGIVTVGDLIEIRIRHFQRSRITCVPVVVTKIVK